MVILSFIDLPYANIDRVSNVVIGKDNKMENKIYNSNQNLKVAIKVTPKLKRFWCTWKFKSF